MSGFFAHVQTRPRLFISAGVGLVAALVAPDLQHAVTRALLGWNVGVWLFLVLVGTMMLKADHEHLRRAAIAQAEGAATVLTLVIVAAVVSIVAIVIELSAAKQGAHHAWPHVLFALATVAGSWLLLPTLFAMNYASLYYRSAHGSGLAFPEPDKTFRPDYADFLYFSFTIAVASQTADVAITNRSMRRLVLLQRRCPRHRRRVHRATVSHDHELEQVRRTVDVTARDVGHHAAFELQRGGHTVLGAVGKLRMSGPGPRANRAHVAEVVAEQVDLVHTLHHDHAAARALAV